MKHLLTSSGFTTPEIADTLQRIVGKEKSDISFAIINEAHAVETGDKSWITEELANFRNYFPGYIAIVDLLALNKEQILEQALECDVLYILGGNTDYLMKVYNDSGFADMLQSELKDKVYVGSSAGSMVMCKRVSTEAYEEVYGETNDYGIKKYIGLHDFAIKPHLGSSEFINNREEVLKRISETYDGKIFALRDDQSILVDENEIIFVGGEIFSC